jgi:hypothetical protein
MNITFRATVIDVREKFHKNYVRGVGKEAEFVDVSLGWFLRLTSSFESIFVGHEKPDIEPDDAVYVSIRKQGRED